MKPDVFDPARGVIFAVLIATGFWAVVALLVFVGWRCW